MSHIPVFPVSILCVDDDADNQFILSRHLAKSVDMVYVAADGLEGYELFLDKRPDIILTDLMMPGISGLEMSRMIRAVEPKVPIILLTSCSSIDFLAEAIDVGITQFLPKPILREKLLTAMQRCFDGIDLERRLKSEQERAEASLLRIRKYESLGILAGGVAHNFNNILTSIIGNAQFAMMKLPPGSPAMQQLQNIDKSAVRAAKIAQQMLDYSGKGVVRITEINVNDMLEKMRDTLDVTIPKNITRTFAPIADPGIIKGDPERLRQVVMDLVINAVEAIGEGEGTINIATGSTVCNNACLDSCWFRDGAEEGLFSFLEVSDNGCGMEPTVIAKLFDPFFSTKFIGRGMGLAAVLGIVRWHKGAVQIDSTPGAGSTFKILLPSIAASEGGING